MCQAKDDFAKALAAMADIYVDDAFGTAHRDNASMYTVPQVMQGKPRVIGFLIEKELKFLGRTLSNPQYFFAITATDGAAQKQVHLRLRPEIQFGDTRQKWVSSDTALRIDNRRETWSIPELDITLQASEEDVAARLEPMVAGPLEVEMTFPGRAKVFVEPDDASPEAIR